MCERQIDLDYRARCHDNVKVIIMTLKNEDTRGEVPVIEISGFNLKFKG